ncbi:hypothetical protein AB0C21_38560, partial [Spirillospora sp. NPDC049024]
SALATAPSAFTSVLVTRCHSLIRSYTENRTVPFLRDELRTAISDSPAHDPGMALEAALHRADAIGIEEVTALIRNAVRLAEPLWDRSRRIRQGDMVLAATSLLAAILVNREGNSDGKVEEYLSDALTALIALTPDAGPLAVDPAPLGKLLVLVRA